MVDRSILMFNLISPTFHDEEMPDFPALMEQDYVKEEMLTVQWQSIVLGTKVHPSQRI